ncbi:prolyl 4-hydroxylase subunit alpha-1 [Ischnura elegans]|uniref:prolyl 4-hydroxylase subunit alpha-1 n=1 Tax=Ischnura elegans TaxID=197161 RepID=UPI001ED8714E|nr:prolyl 4-hydroxylase subunit alpha-1 [Ischnura elegans]XP_046405341.1 prolyl 4-hydroxylase subunit alpha-1 [Ischnura elegans]
MSLGASLLALILFSVSICCHGELYTALADMEELLETEAVLIRTLEGYMDAQENKLRLLKRFAAEYAKEHDEASQDVQQYLANPINAYLLVKRLTTDWKEVEATMMDDVGLGFVENITRYREVLKFPSDEDLNGAAVALMRLQDTYKLDTASVARGELNGVQYSTALTAGGCFELGRQSYNNGDFYHTVLWMTEALQRYEEERNKTTVKADILEYLAFSMYQQGNVHSALQMTNELLEIIPTHQRALGNKVYYEAEIESKSGRHRKGEDGSADPLDEVYTVAEKKVVPVQRDSPVKPKETDSYGQERELYEMLCRNEISLPPADQAKLTCRYVDKGVPFLKLARVKEEEAYLKPRIVIYHDVIYDSEMETIKKLAQPKFRRATVQNYKTGELETANYRISKSAWLKAEDDPKIAAVNQRVEDLTGLTVETAEELQVVNYGIGGHYEPHFDFARREEKNAFKSLGTGNRIATILFYMSDVHQGGATVFPALKVALWPRKGAAAFWFNLHRSGEGDFLTRHAACPVLTGSKWVSNKWFHEVGQEFKRPCGLTKDAE